MHTDRFLSVRILIMNWDETHATVFVINLQCKCIFDDNTCIRITAK